MPAASSGVIAGVALTVAVSCLVLLLRVLLNDRDYYRKKFHESQGGVLGGEDG